jgi:hypothetical protein
MWRLKMTCSSACRQGAAAAAAASSDELVIHCQVRERCSKPSAPSFMVYHAYADSCIEQVVHCSWFLGVSRRSAAVCHLQ